MKVNFIFIIIVLFNSIITFIPNWDITINDDLASNTNPYTYTAFEKTTYFTDWNVYLKLERTITKSSSDVSVTNYVTMGMNYVDVGPKEVPFDNVDSYYNFHNKYYICPKGAHHVYDFTNQKYITPTDFYFQNQDYDLKCHYNEESKMFIVLYLRNGDYTWYSTYIHDGTALEDMRKVGKLSDQLYDFKLESQGSDSYYYLMGLVRVGNWLKVANVKIKLLKNDEGYNMVDSQKDIVEEKTYSQVYYLNKYADSQYNDFFYFTYDDPSEFYNGYTTTASPNYRDVLKYEIKNNVFSFEFKEEFEVEKIDFMLYNRFIYYIMKSKESSKKYYGIFDTKLNKPVFNTDEELVQFIPNSGTDMLAITSKNAYKICAIKDGTSCVDYCSNNYLIDTTKGSQCSSSSSCTYEAYPYGICIKECDYMQVLRNNSLCGLCKQFDSKNIYKLNGTNTCIATIKEESMNLTDTKWNIVSCKTGYILENDDCVKINDCHPLCEKYQCSGPSTDDNNQLCKSCQPNYFLENVNCKTECSEGYIISEDGKECQKCTLNNCQKLEKNNLTCICETCNNHYYLKNNECSICDDSCNGCQGEPTNCTSCQDNYFLYNNKCYSCQYEHCEKRKEDNCACDICKEGYYNEGFVCKKCKSDNCKKCTSEKCLECENNFFVNDEGICTQCPTNCEIKVSETTCQCKVCKEGYFLNNYQCEKCDETCATCEGNKNNCIECAKNGFRNDNNKCELCDEICSTCEGNKKNCTTCGEHLFRNENDECTYCDNSCKGCSLSETNCTSCNDGNYLINNACKECDSKCLTCENKDECLSCHEGTYLINDEFNKTCVDNCTEYGREFSKERAECVPLRRNNGTDGDGANKANDDLLLWIFVGIIGFILLIITICICIKCCRNRIESDSIEKTIDLDLTDGQNGILNDD